MRAGTGAYKANRGLTLDQSPRDNFPSVLQDAPTLTVVIVLVALGLLFVYAALIADRDSK